MCTTNSNTGNIGSSADCGYVYSGGYKKGKGIKAACTAGTYLTIEGPAQKNSGIFDGCCLRPLFLFVSPFCSSRLCSHVCPYSSQRVGFFVLFLRQKIAFREKQMYSPFVRAGY